MSTIPKAARRYLIDIDGIDCVGWRGNKFYGRPNWTLWMQQAVWEEANGSLPPKSRVSEVCDTIGCLLVDHLVVKSRPPRIPKTICRRCGGVLSRDVNDKTYCPLCNKNRMRARRKATMEGDDEV